MFDTFVTGPMAWINSPIPWIILIIVLLLFGGAKIPEMMRGLGQGMKEFKKGMNENEDDELRQARERDEAREREVRARVEAEMAREREKERDRDRENDREKLTK